MISRKKGPYTSLIRNLTTSLVLYERITTTETKGKLVKSVTEGLINSVRAGSVNDRRRLLGFLFDKNATKKVLEELLPRYKNVKTGFITTYHAGNRKGDNAKMMIVELAKKNPPTGGESIESKDGKDTVEKGTTTEDSGKTKAPSLGRGKTKTTSKTSAKAK